MTPLAFELLKDLTTPGAFRSSQSRDVFWYAVMNCKFFDAVAIGDLIVDTAKKMNQYFERSNKFNDRLAFLPAPMTWIEREIFVDEILPDENRTVQSRCREATILDGHDCSTSSARVVQIRRDHYGQWTATRPIGPAVLPLVHSGQKPDRKAQEAWRAKVMATAPDVVLPSDDDWPLMAPHFAVYAALAFINTPRVIGRRQHMPHERIEREKLKALRLVGKFPLRAWTEIILKVALPDDRAGEPSTEAHLTGEKCLHFCRTFLRVRLGQLEYVEAHWRGNPALSMKRSRYRLTPPDGPQPEFLFEEAAGART